MQQTENEHQTTLEAFGRVEEESSNSNDLLGFRYLIKRGSRPSLLRDLKITRGLRTSIMLSQGTHAKLANLMRRLSDSAAVEGLSRRDVRLMDVLDEIVNLALEDTAGPCYDGQLIASVLNRAERHGKYRRKKRDSKQKGLPVEPEMVEAPELEE